MDSENMKIKGVTESTKIIKTRTVCYGSLSLEHKKIYDEADLYISNKHPIKCVCGKLCTGLHEKTCSKFRSAVNREFFKRIEDLNSIKKE